MPYTPDAAKMAEARFFLRNSCPIATSYLRVRNGEQLIIVVNHARQTVKLKDDESQRMEFSCPDEAAFDIVMQAAGFSAPDYRE